MYEEEVFSVMDSVLAIGHRGFRIDVGVGDSFSGSLVVFCMPVG